MGRNAKDVLSYHKAQSVFYKYIDGKTKYFGQRGPKNPENNLDKPPSGETYETALAAYLQWKQDQANPVRNVKVHPKDAKGGRWLEYDMNVKSPAYADVADKNPGDPTLLALASLRTMLDSKTSKADKEAVYESFVQLLTTKPLPHESKPARATGLKLAEVLAFWQTAGKPDPQYSRDQSNRFKQFIDCVGDIHLCNLTIDHARQFIVSLKDKTPNNQRAILGAVKIILNFLLKPKAQKSEQYDLVKASLPHDLKSITAIMNVDSDELTEPDDSCKKPFPADGFKAITAAIDKAGDKRFKAIWLLSCQCGLNLTDIERLVWGSSIVLDGTPHFVLSRLKRGKGQRVIPLHADTVKALREYRKTLKNGRGEDGQPVFWGVDVYVNLPVKPRALRDEFQEYRGKAVIKSKKGNKPVDSCWQYKHLRNVGPNLRIKAGLPVDMTWAFLGHDNHLGEAQKYEYQEPKRLKPLVDAIAKAYF